MRIREYFMQLHRGIATRLRTGMDFMLPILLDKGQMRFCFGAVFEVLVSLSSLSALFVAIICLFICVPLLLIILLIIIRRMSRCHPHG